MKNLFLIVGLLFSTTAFAQTRPAGSQFYRDCEAATGFDCSSNPNAYWSYVHGLDAVVSTASNRNAVNPLHSLDSLGGSFTTPPSGSSSGSSNSGSMTTQELMEGTILALYNEAIAKIQQAQMARGLAELALENNSEPPTIEELEIALEYARLAEAAEQEAQEAIEAFETAQNEAFLAGYQGERLYISTVDSSATTIFGVPNSPGGFIVPPGINTCVVQGENICN